MKGRPVILDGAAGTLLWEMAEKAGIPREPVWKYSLEQPELAKALSRAYLEAGSRMIQTNTFAANDYSVERTSSYSVEEVVAASVRLAKEAAQAYAEEKHCEAAKVYLSSGPLSVLMEPYGTVSAGEVEAIYRKIMKAAAAEKPDFILLETFMDLQMMRAAAGAALETGLPVICSFSFAKKGRTMMGDRVSQIVQTLEPMGVAAFGVNCSSGPQETLPVLREFAGCTEKPLWYKPNLGTGEKVLGIEEFAEAVRPALGLADYLGACCGSSPAYIRRLAELAAEMPD